MPADIKFGGFLKQSLIDFPGNITAVAFTAGCNFRCYYCHNPQLVLPGLENHAIGAAEILAYIEKNRFLLDAITITGGEPTLYAGLPPFCKEIKRLGLKVKLDTNGTNPEMVELLIGEKLADFIAMDIKAPLNFAAYQKIVGHTCSEAMFKQVERTVALIKSTGIGHEFRTTLETPFDPHLQHKIEASVGEPVTWQPVKRKNPVLGDYCTDSNQ